MKLTKILSAVIAAVMCLSLFTACNKEAEYGGSMRDITTMELVNEMGVGINLGNTFESAGSWISPTGVTAYEQAWGSPIITREMITGYAECGFGVLRIPVAWSNMMGEDYTINATYLARVKQVVGWALEEDMYVILNIHWDGGWESIWNRYSNQGDKEKSFNLLNEINQKFVDIVRASGGNNAERHLLIAGYNTDFDLTCDPLYKMPNDPMNRCAVSVHYYTPSTFAILEEDASWGKARTEWGSEADFAELNKYMTMMKETYIDKGIPVIVGEFGCSTSNKTPEMIRLYLTSVCEAAYDNGLCPVLWDITDVFYNREEAKFIDPELLEGLMAVKE